MPLLLLFSAHTAIMPGYFVTFHICYKILSFLFEYISNIRLARFTEQRNTALYKGNLENGKQLGRNIFAGVPWKANVCFDVLLVKKHFFLLQY